MNARNSLNARRMNKMGAGRKLRGGETMQEYCDYCDGTGIDPEDEHNEKPCPYCGGEE
jgi:DnaJ-class molecular chaperone